MRFHDVQEDILVGTWSGAVDHDWTLRGEAPPMVCVGVLLEGEVSMEPAQGPGLTLRPETTVLYAMGQAAQGADVVKAHGRLCLVEARFPLRILLPLVADTAMAVLREALFTLTGDGSDPQDGGVFRVGPASPGARRIARDILAACEGGEGPFVKGLYLRAKALELLALALRDILPAPAVRVPARDRKRIAMACRLLEDDYGRRWSTGALARHVGLSEKRLQVGFRHLMGASLHAYLRSIRLRAAMTLLGNGQSVTETAYAVGFSSLSHFSKAFKDHTGVSPREWRNTTP
ncbi:AraC family transcriptional regulator [Pararhodospirillum oryzae]|uniref:AraC family transcriptional regulator n=1 Tax=Pararhodospirillum oryzae TaxID=478448 RepID=A0A512HB53_9PROT|nr:AraC family transcriptional regulator [Pararhodospirillum oryzae]